MNNFSAYYGVILVILGAVTLTASYFLDMVDVNIVQIAGLLLIFAGAVCHGFCVAANLFHKK